MADKKVIARLRVEVKHAEENVHHFNAEGNEMAVASNAARMVAFEEAIRIVEGDETVGMAPH